MAKNNRQSVKAMNMNQAGNNGQKAKNFKKSMKNLFTFIKPQILLLSIGIFIAIASTLLTVFCPKLLGDITNELQNALEFKRAIDLALIGKISLVLLILYISSAITDYITGWIMSSVSAKVGFRFREEIIKKINKLPLSYFDSTNNGEILSRITNDVDTVTQTLNQSLANIVWAITKVIGVLVVMFVICWQMTLIALISVPVSAILMMIIIKYSQKQFLKQQTSLGEMNGHIEQIYSAHNVVKVFNGEQKAVDEFNKINEQMHNSAYKSQFLSGMMHPITQFISNISYVAICIVGGALVLDGAIMVGAITSFMLYIRQFNQPISQIASIAGTLQSTAAAAERVFEFLEIEEQDNEEHKSLSLLPQDVKGEVEFKHVSFGYVPNKIIIKDFSLVAKPGQKIAIVGPTGAGKTTLVNLLMRFYEINSGDITIDGISINSLKRENVRQLFSMVLQDTWLFEGTIKENIAYGDKSVSDEEIEKACILAGVDHFIRTQPNGYNFVIDENASLSQGQKQLMTIARAMVQNSPMLILDEATSSVDTRTEIAIQKAMDSLMNGRTSFIIAHRLSTIKNADIILVMDNGDIVEQGTHDELLAKNGFYAELYYSQFDDAKANVG